MEINDDAHSPCLSYAIPLTSNKLPGSRIGKTFFIVLIRPEENFPIMNVLTTIRRLRKYCCDFLMEDGHDSWASVWELLMAEEGRKSFHKFFPCKLLALHFRAFCWMKFHLHCFVASPIHANKQLKPWKAIKTYIKKLTEKSYDENVSWNCSSFKPQPQKWTTASCKQASAIKSGNDLQASSKRKKPARTFFSNGNKSCSEQQAVHTWRLWDDCNVPRMRKCNFYSFSEWR